MSQLIPKTPLSKNTDICDCGACGERFNSTFAFDRHRVGDYGERRCLDALAMRELGFVRNHRGHWVTGRKKLDEYDAV